MKLRVLWWNDLNAAPQSSMLSQRRGRGASQSGLAHIYNISDQLETTQELKSEICTVELKSQIHLPKSSNVKEFHSAFDFNVFK